MKILANDGIDNQGKSLLEKAGFTVITEKVAQENLAETINKQGFSALTVRSATKVRKDVIDACPNLKLVARGGVGMDNIDVDYVKSKGVHIVNTPAASSNSVAELVFAHLFNMVRFLYDSNRQMPANASTQFDSLKKKYANGTELRGKTIGIIGFGRIGQSVAKIALGLGMKIKANDSFVPEATIEIDINGNKINVPVKTTSIDDVLKNSDFITIHIPSGELIGTKEIDMMKKGVMLINTARGGVINEQALLAGLSSGKIASAGLDVFTNEPKPDAQLLSHPAISLTPHIGAATLEAQERIGVELAEKIISLLK